MQVVFKKMNAYIEVKLAQFDNMLRSNQKRQDELEVKLDDKLAELRRQFFSIDLMRDQDHFY